MARKLVVEIIGDARSLQKSFDTASKSTKKFGKEVTGTRSTVRSLGRSVAFASGTFLGAAGLVSAARAAFSEMADSQRVAAQTAAVLKSTGGAANVTAKQVDDLATSLLNVSGVDDEVVKSGENLLLTFRSVRNETGKGNDVFTQATKAALDMSVALGTDMTSAALQVGKALNDPIRGLTALRRAGVSFTEEQTKQIKALVKSGQTLEAQKIILQELQKEFGGSAKAAGRTLPGQLNKLRNSLLNVGASIAQTLTPAITKMLEQANKWLSNSKNQKEILADVKAVTEALAAGFRVLKAVLETVNKITGSTANTLKILLGVLVAIKALNMAASLASTARSLGLIATQAGAARGSVGLLKGSLIGKAGLVAAAGIASYELTKLGLKVTGLDKKLKGFGGAIANLVGAGGNTPAALSSGAYRFLRNQAARLEAAGMTPAQAAARIAVTHPGVPRHDIDVLAGVYGSRPTIVIHNLNTNAGNAKQLEDDLTRRAKARPHTRRGR